MINKVYLSGKVTREPQFHYTDRGIDFYQFYISVVRLSKVADVIPVIVPETLVNQIEIKVGINISVKGEYRSFKHRPDKKLEVYLFGKHIDYSEPETYYNNIKLEGTIINKGELRTTVLTHKKIVDVLLLVERSKTKTYTIPCIIWNLTDEEYEDLKLDDKILIQGRIQSRDYIKVYDDKTTENKTAYEVSVRKYEKY